MLYSDACIEATRAALVNAVACGSVEWKPRYWQRQGSAGRTTLVLSPDDFEKCLHDERIRALSARTTCIIDAKVERLTSAEGVPARVKCVLNDGTAREKFVESFKGSPQDRLTIDEVCERFRALAAHRFDEAEIESWLDTARTIESRANVAGLFTLRPKRAY